MIDLAATFASFPQLETERFILRAAEPGDAPAIFRIMSDAQVTRYFGRLPMTAPAEADEHVQALEQSFREWNGIRWMIAPRAGGALVGSCGFWRLLVPHARAEVGYELAPEWWGQGAMTEALAAILGFGFGTMRLHSVEAQIHPANIGSRRVLEKLGFVREGYFRENYFDVAEAGFTDTAVFSLLQADWERHREARP